MKVILTTKFKVKISQIGWSDVRNASCVETLYFDIEIVENIALAKAVPNLSSAHADLLISYSKLSLGSLDTR